MQAKKYELKIIDNIILFLYHKDHKELEDLAKKRESSVIWDMIESLESQKRCLGTE